MGKHHGLVLRDHSYSWFQICAQQFSGALQVSAFFFVPQYHSPCRGNVKIKKYAQNSTRGTLSWAWLQVLVHIPKLLADEES